MSSFCLEFLFIFLSRCPHPVCATLRGPLRELYQNNVLVPGVLIRRMLCESCGLKFIIFPHGNSQTETMDSCTVMALVMAQDVQDKYLLDLPHGYFSWRHCHSVLSAFLALNEPWTRQVSTDWAVCRTMSVRIIAVRGDDEVRELDRSVLAENPQRLIKGPVPIPQYPKRRGHLQAGIDIAAGFSGEYIGPRDLGLDMHRDWLYGITGGEEQNRAPRNVRASDMFGIASAPHYIGQFEVTSSESGDSIAEVDPGSPSDDDDDQLGSSDAVGKFRCCPSS